MDRVGESRISFLAFFLLWAERQGWVVPDIHVRAALWLESRGSLALMRCFRGFSKSTLLDCYNAWRAYTMPQVRILLQSESDGTAYKSSRGTQHVLRHHPLTRGLLPEGRGTVESWSVLGAVDPRNPTFHARGILSNVTSARADEAQNDDVEVPRNIGTPEAREKLRFRLEEQVHILVPGGRRLFIGTPHTHESLYNDIAALGADCLTIPLFSREWRVEEDVATKTRFAVAFKPEYLFAGIGREARLLAEGTDWRWDAKGAVVFAESPGATLDGYADCAWPERFTRDELLKRRRETRTLNGWDSQYQLHAKPVSEVRLDPGRLVPYAVEPHEVWLNRTRTLWLGRVQLVGVSVRWDPSSGQPGRDASSLSVVYTDAAGRYYWHRLVALVGDVFVQCQEVKRLAQALGLTSVTVETNGPGTFLPAVLRKVLRDAPRVVCAVVEDFSTVAKAERILDAFEAPLASGYLWAHTSVCDEAGLVWRQMRDFNPVARRQADDHLDSAAGAIAATPVRVGRAGGRIPPATELQDWRPSAGAHEVSFEA